MESAKSGMPDLHGTFMPNYRRVFRPGGTYFFTIVTHQRRRIFHDESNIQLLRVAIRTIRHQEPFEIDEAVVLPDHIHFIWTLPEADSGYSRRIGRVKTTFTQRLFAAGKTQVPRRSGGYSTVWQHRFWEHTIQDADDYERHMNYIHFNPVKHGLAACPHAWPYSSFHACVRNNLYSQDWCCACEGRTVREPDFSTIACAGEWD